jgi:class 3 adenylate cyclase
MARKKYENKLRDTITFNEEANEQYDIYILFIDMCGSTTYKVMCKQKGFPEFTWVMRQITFLSVCNEIINKNNGIVIKTIGDEVMFYFNKDCDPKIIIDCCKELFAKFNALKTFKGEHIIKTKISIDYGECYNGNIFDGFKLDPIGSPIDKCARLNKCSAENKIVISKEFKEILCDKYNTEYNDLISKTENLPGFGNTEFFEFP